MTNTLRGPSEERAKRAASTLSSPRPGETSDAPPRDARVVVIGGGAVGCSVLYHLALRGWRDCVLLDRDELTSGATWLSAGHCQQYSAAPAMMRMQAQSNALYAKLGAEVNAPLDYVVTGGVRLAQSQERLQEFAQISSVARGLGLELGMVGQAELKDLLPRMVVYGLEGGLWEPRDGHIDPIQLTHALAKGARDLGQRILRYTPVTAIRRELGRWVVVTPKGEVRGEYIVNAAGAQADTIGAMISPFGACRERVPPIAQISHQYILTDAASELGEQSERLPILRDPDAGYYLRQSGDGLLLGCYEAEAAPLWASAGGSDLSQAFQQIEGDLARLEPSIDVACRRLPLLSRTHVERVINGAFTVTPDGLPLIGPSPGAPGAFETCGFSHGVALAGGAGKLCADWIVDGETEYDASMVDPRRFLEHATRSYARTRALAVYRDHDALRHPGRYWDEARPAKTSPLYPRLQAKGAVFGEFGGWERPLWFPLAGDETKPVADFERQPWHARVGVECAHLMEKVGVIDLCGMARLEVAGRGAAAWLRRLITGALPTVGFSDMIYMASPKGKLISAMTAARFDDDRFWLLGEASNLRRDMDWLRAHLPEDGGIRLEDRTGAWSMLLLAGPKSRELLSKITDSDISDAAFPWRSHQTIEVGAARLVAIRACSAGELGWELHAPVEHVTALYDKLWAVGADLGLRDFGMLALDVMGVEKGRRGRGVETISDYTPFEMGLEKDVRLSKGDFIGRAALAKLHQQGPQRRAVTLYLDPPGEEDLDAEAPAFSTVYDEDEPVGMVTSGVYGHRVGCSLALAVVAEQSALDGRELEVEIVGSRRRAVVGPTAAYDPEDERLKS